MNIPCSVIRDLLPLYAENLASEESAALVREHLETCAACREQLELTQRPTAPIPESGAPIKSLKNELKRRRRRTAAIAALSVFLLLFALFARVTEENPLPYHPELLQVEGLEDYDPSAEPTYSSANTFQPEGSQTAYPGQALVIARNEQVSGVASESYLDDETGELTVYLQYFSTSMGFVIDDAAGGFSAVFLENDAAKDVFYPAPDRVIYGFGQDQVLLWGEAMNGGVQILPRLALAYYVLIAAGLALILAALWTAFRKKPAGPVLRQLFLVPTAYLLGHLFIKGTGTLSIFLLRDLTMICVEAAAFYALLSFSYRAWRQRMTDRKA